MDYLDTFDLDTTNKKCHRVRSWYLYEQYKTLQKNQLDAAQLLKSKSYQNNILRQELKERRARRKLCDQYGLCESELKLSRAVQSCPSTSTDELFESFCELHKEYEADEFKEGCSCDGSQTSRNDDIENKNDDFSDSESIQSVIDNVTLEENSAHNVKQELEIVKKNIAKNINLQLETVKENIQCCKMFSKINNEDGFLRENSDLNDSKRVKNKTQNIFERLFSIWSNLVVFAFNSIQLNHGNCYCQCSSQLLTAILACDFLRKGVDGVCKFKTCTIPIFKPILVGHYLQSYVSPIKYATSDSGSSLSAPDTSNGKCRRKKIENHEKSYKITHYKNKYCSCNKHKYKLKTFDRRCCSENKYKSNYSSNNRINGRICRGSSEPWHSVGRFEKNFGLKYYLKSHNSLNGKYSNKNLCNCNYLKDIVNPILKVARYIDNILQDVEESPGFKYGF